MPNTSIILSILQYLKRSLSYVSINETIFFEKDKHMHRNPVAKFFIIALPVIIALGAGYWNIKETRTMAYAEEKPEFGNRIPPIDQKVPAHTETATFALG